MGPGCEGLTGGGAKCLGLLCKAHDWQVMMEREGLSDGYGALRNTALMRLLSFCSFRATCFSMFKVKAVPPKHYFWGLRLQAIIPVLQASRKKNCFGAAGFEKLRIQSARVWAAGFGAVRVYGFRAQGLQ